MKTALAEFWRGWWDNQFSYILEDVYWRHVESEEREGFDFPLISSRQPGNVEMQLMEETPQQPQKSRGGVST